MIANNYLRRHAPTRIERDAYRPLASQHVIVRDDDPAESVDEEAAAVLQTCLDAYDSAFDPVIHGDLGRDFARGCSWSNLYRIDDSVGVRQFDREHLAAAHRKGEVPAVRLTLQLDRRNAPQPVTARCNRLASLAVKAGAKCDGGRRITDPYE